MKKDVLEENKLFFPGLGKLKTHEIVQSGM